LEEAVDDNHTHKVALTNCDKAAFTKICKLKSIMTMNKNPDDAQRASCFTGAANPIFGLGFLLM
jgi:hypothetical protein